MNTYKQVSLILLLIVIVKSLVASSGEKKPQYYNIGDVKVNDTIFYLDAIAMGNGTFHIYVRKDPNYISKDDHHALTIIIEERKVANTNVQDANKKTEDLHKETLDILCRGRELMAEYKFYYGCLRTVGAGACLFITPTPTTLLVCMQIMDKNLPKDIEACINGAIDKITEAVGKEKEVAALKASHNLKNKRFKEGFSDVIDIICADRKMHRENDGKIIDPSEPPSSSAVPPPPPQNNPLKNVVGYGDKFFEVKNIPTDDAGWAGIRNLQKELQLGRERAQAGRDNLAKQLEEGRKAAESGREQHERQIPQKSNSSNSSEQKPQPKIKESKEWREDIEVGSQLI